MWLTRVLSAVLVAAAVLVAVPSGAEARNSYQPARCEWLAPHLADAGLPVGTFLRIAWRESGCAVGGVHVRDRDDLSTSRFGLNFKGRNMQRAWRNLCGATSYAQMRDLDWDLRCTKAAYDRLGLRPWRYAR